MAGEAVSNLFQTGHLEVKVPTQRLAWLEDLNSRSRLSVGKKIKTIVRV